MVHALRECWRVLRPGATLVDLRPVHSNPTLEVIRGGNSALAGRINDDEGVADDDAADRAVAEMVRRHFFSPQVEDSFPFNYYWNSLEELLAYADEEWRGFAYVPAAVARQARHYEAAYGGRCRLRIRRKIHVGVYRRLPASPFSHLSKSHLL